MPRIFPRFALLNPASTRLLRKTKEKARKSFKKRERDIDIFMKFVYNEFGHFA